MTFLADTSLVLGLNKAGGVAPQWVDAVRAGLVGICPVVEAELIPTVLTAADRNLLRRHLRSLFGWHPMPDSAWRFVQRVQDRLVDLGLHRGPSIVDLLVAATADAAHLIVLHMDTHFDTIAGVTGLRVQRADRP